MTNITRLPTQHSKKPHCNSCNRDLPAVGNCTVETRADWDSAKLLGMTFHVRCECGAIWDLYVGLKA